MNKRGTEGKRIIRTAGTRPRLRSRISEASLPVEMTFVFTCRMPFRS